jgi:hypothetical protein
MDRILMLAIAVALTVLLVIATVHFTIRHVRWSRERSGAAMIGRLESLPSSAFGWLLSPI